MSEINTEHFDFPRAVSKNAKILVAEDNEDLRELISDILTSENMDIDFAEDGEIAVEMASHIHYDLILMDLSLPRLNGELAMQKIKKTDFSIPIVALSAYPESYKKDTCIELGFDDYISKSFSNLDDFIDRVKFNLTKQPTTKNLM
jgi:two-component system response regulator ResD